MDERIRAELLELGTKLTRLMQRVETLEHKPEVPHVDPAYFGPFAVRVKSDGLAAKVGQGYVTAGDLGEYDWPQSNDTDEVGCPASDGQWLVVMRVVVDPDYGCFTEDYRPTVEVWAAGDHHGLQSLTACHVVLAELTVKTLQGVRKITAVRQRQRSDVTVPVRLWFGSSIAGTWPSIYYTDLTFYACWRNYDRQLMQTQVVAAVTGMSDSGEATYPVVGGGGGTVTVPGHIHTVNVENVRVVLWGMDKGVVDPALVEVCHYGE